jgi:hypothetical protein
MQWAQCTRNRGAAPAATASPSRPPPGSRGNPLFGPAQQGTERRGMHDGQIQRVVLVRDFLVAELTKLLE